MSAIGPGDFVECVDAARKRPEDPPSALVKGAIYTVDDVLPDYGDGAGVTLVGVPNAHGRYLGYRIERFRPVRRPSQSVIRAMLEPHHEPEPA